MSENNSKSDKQHKETSSNPSNSEHKGEHTIFLGSKKALTGGIIAGVIALVGQYMVGQVYSGWEARKLLESVNSSTLYFGSAIVGGSATILALMLTMLGLTNNSDSEFDSIFYKRIQRISQLATVALIVGVLLLLFLSIPVQESDQVPTSWYKIIYYVLVTIISGLSGLIVGIVLMLLNAINSVIDTISPTADEDKEKAKEREKHESEADKEKIDEAAKSE